MVATPIAKYEGLYKSGMPADMKPFDLWQQMIFSEA